MCTKLKAGSVSGILLLSLLCIGLNGCGGNTRTFTVGEGKDQAVVTADGNGNATVKVGGADASSASMTTGTSAVYPAEMPFPQYPSSKLSFQMKVEGKTGSQTISLETSDSIDKILSHYKSWFGSNGWNIQFEGINSGTGTITAQKGNQTASIMAMPAQPPASGTAIQIMVSGDK